MPLNADIDGIIDPLLATFSARTLASIEGELTTIYVSGTAQMTKWAGLPFEGPPAKAALDFAKKRGAELVTQMDKETKRRLGRVISDGIKNKRGVAGISRDIRNTFTDMTKYRSELIARTETANALGEAFQDRGKQLGVTGKEWVTVGDQFVDVDICEANEAQGVIPFDQTFQSGHMTPPGHPACRCLPHNTVIHANDIQRVFRRWYEGDLIEVTTALGNNLSGTPNHPVLTDLGWIGLGTLKEGDYIISAPVSEGMFSIDPDIDYIPSTIGEIFDALSVIGSTERMVGTPMDFHGDGRQEQIDVVTVDDSLSDREQATPVEHLKHFRFASADREMCFVSGYRPLRRVQESQAIGLASITPGDISSLQSGGDNIPVNIETLCQTEFGLPIEVRPDNQAIIKTILVSGGGRPLMSADSPSLPFSAHQPSFPQDNRQSLVADMVSGGNSLNTIPRTIIPDRILSINRTRFAHYVYNLQTYSGHYIANSIISHNCAAAPVMV